jgi:hypothetical protein
VTVTQSGVVIWQKPIPAGGTEELDFGEPVGVDSNLKHVTSASTISAIVTGN